jgi:hypothetical protein
MRELFKIGVSQVMTLRIFDTPRANIALIIRHSLIRLMSEGVEQVAPRCFLNLHKKRTVDKRESFSCKTWNWIHNSKLLRRTSYDRSSIAKETTFNNKVKTVGRNIIYFRNGKPILRYSWFSNSLINHKQINWRGKKHGREFFFKY